MSGVTITINAEQLQAQIQAIAKRCGSARPAMEIVGSIVRSSVVRNFELEGRPKWKPLSPATVRQRGAAHPILRRQGLAGGLAGSISYQAEDDRVRIGTNKVYAAVHQFGARKGHFGTKSVRVREHVRQMPGGRQARVRAHNRRQPLPWGDIPARPFLIIQNEDWDEMLAALKDYVLGGFAGQSGPR